MGLVWGENPGKNICVGSPPRIVASESLPDKYNTTHWAHLQLDMLFHTPWCPISISKAFSRTASDYFWLTTVVDSYVWG